MFRYALGAGLGPFLIRSLAGSGMVRVGAMLASFAVGVLLARGLGVEGYGYYGIALAVITIAGVPGELGIPKLVTRELAAAAARNDNAGLFGVLKWGQKTCLRLSAVAAILVIAGGLVVYMTGSSTLGAAIMLGAPAIPLLALARLRGGALQGLHHLVLGQIPANLLRPLLLALLLIAAYAAGVRIGAPGAMLLTSVTAAAAFLVAGRWLRTRLPDLAPASVVTHGRRWIASSIPIALTDGMRGLQAELSTLLLGITATAAMAGLFRIAIVTATMAAVAITVVNHVAFPVIARLHAQGDQVRLQKSITGLAWAQLGGVALVAVPLVIVPEQLLTIAFGQSYAPAADALRLLAAAQIANAAFGPNVALLNMTNHERRVTRAMGIGLAVNIVLLPIFAATWGLLGAAAAFVAALLSWNILTWYDARRLLGIETSVLPAPRRQAGPGVADAD